LESESRHHPFSCHDRLVATDLTTVLDVNRQSNTTTDKHIVYIQLENLIHPGSRILHLEIFNIPAKNEYKFLTPHQGWTLHSLQQLQVTFLGEAGTSFVSCHPAIKNLINVSTENSTILMI
jgi:hypothetical protein